MRFDLARSKAGVAYITDSSISGAGQHHRGRSRQRRELAQPERPRYRPRPTRRFIPVVEGERFAVRERKATGLAHRLAWTGSAIAADGGEPLLPPCRAGTSYSVPTRLLLDRSASDEAVAAAVVDLGERAPRTASKPTTGAASMPATIGATASAGAGPTANGSPSRTIPGSCGLKRSPWRPAGISTTANQLHPPVAVPRGRGPAREALCPVPHPHRCRTGAAEVADCGARNSCAPDQALRSVCGRSRRRSSRRCSRFAIEAWASSDAIRA